jgi:hypothetical protein
LYLYVELYSATRAALASYGKSGLLNIGLALNGDSGDSGVIISSSGERKDHFSLSPFLNSHFELADLEESSGRGNPHVGPLNVPEDVSGPGRLHSES